MPNDAKIRADQFSLTITMTENFAKLDEAIERTNVEIHRLVLALADPERVNERDQLRREISKLQHDLRLFKRAKKAELPIIEC